MQHLNIVGAACSYLQYKQCTDGTVPIQRVFVACKQFGIKPGKALDYLDKWAANLKNQDNESAQASDSGS